ncbi:response regulator [Domibacillus sp. PGB-M46]|uniref:response regulator transcription factor n=1 Tax=Domibacillus sp. PGB-M46 TaxID=2910255 RepID=UPI001F5AECCD|nr:response regulator [Domibacillus sp. PGB-M46]MCI2255765.1 response regulator [Domibacillus sp. PGB-M46]
MLKAVVFDDNLAVVEGMKHIINWSEYGIKLVGTAHDGKSALSLFYSLKPDIILTDIEMPGITGLQLIEEVMKTVPSTVCVVFSGHREFDYVKQALKLGVTDFLEKPLTIAMIEDTLCKVKTRINSREATDVQSIEGLNIADHKDFIKYKSAARNTAVPLFVQEDAIIQAIQGRDKLKLNQVLDQYTSWFEKEEIDRDEMEGELLKLVYRGTDVVENTWGLDRLSTMKRDFPHIEIRQIKTKSEMVNWIRNRLNSLIDLMPNLPLNRKHTAVEKACTYIAEHYDRDITLHEVADIVGLNPNYLSLLFKEEMGTTYIKYLTELRMEKAKLMLQDGHRVMKVGEKVGYCTYRHFSHLFKKYVGVSPGQFKKSLGS